MWEIYKCTQGLGYPFTYITNITICLVLCFVIRVIIHSVHTINWACADWFSYKYETLFIYMWNSHSPVDPCSSIKTGWLSLFLFLAEGKGRLRMDCVASQQGTAANGFPENWAGVGTPGFSTCYFPVLLLCPCLISFSNSVLNDLFLECLNFLYLLACTNNEVRFIFSVNWQRSSYSLKTFIRNQEII